MEKSLILPTIINIRVGPFLLFVLEFNRGGVFQCLLVQKAN